MYFGKEAKTYTDRNSLVNFLQVVIYLALVANRSTELLPLIKSYYLKEAIKYSQKIKSGKCFTN